LFSLPDTHLERAEWASQKDKSMAQSLDINVTLLGKRVFADIIELTVLK
jgi:hypothetical protein